MSQVREYVERIVESVEGRKHRYIEVSQAIHARPEIGNEEFFACQTHTELLEKEGFSVETGVAGHETSFYAVKKSGKAGPRIAFLAEYDALPGIGHACGHNIIGTTSVAAGVALAEVLDDIGGEVLVLGTPAEEGGPNGSAKGSFVKHGLLTGVDAALMLHPAGKTAITSETLAVDPLDFHFYGKAAHASGSPEEGINALDGVIQLFNGINALREHLPSDVKIHGIITHGGDAPNIVPAYAAARFFIRAATWKRTEEVAEKVRAIAEAAALATGSKVKIERFQNEVKDFVLNDRFDQVLKEELEVLGETVATERSGGLGSTDAGNISYEVPTVHGYIKIGPDELIAHTIEFREAAKSERGNEAILIGAKALAKTALRLLLDPGLLQEIKDEFARRIEEKKE